MQKQTIKKIITKKMEDWLETITDSTLRFDVRKSLLVSGGSIASLFLNTEVNDYDVYIQDRGVLLRLVDYYTLPYKDSITVLDGVNRDELINTYKKGFSTEEFLKHNSVEAIVLRTLKPDQIKIHTGGGGGYKVVYPGVKLDDSEKSVLPKYRPLFFSPNAISLSDDVQIVNRFFGTPQEIHKTFDFVHATNYFTFNEGVVTNLNAIESLLSKTLYYQGSQYPLTSVIRSKKFVNRGFKISAGELLKMMFQISKLNLEDMDVLEEQLIGVDVAYFQMLIKALRDRQEAEPGFKLTCEYLNEIINRVFRDEE